jgi:hypothetical protein
MSAFPGAELLGPAGAIFGAISGASAQRRANRANEQRYQQVLALLKAQGEASKVAIANSGQEERGAISQSTIGRGLYNSSVLDTLNNMSRTRESQANTAVDESVASRMADVMSSRNDVSSGVNPYMGALQQLGSSLAPTPKMGTAGGSAGIGSEFTQGGSLYDLISKMLRGKPGGTYGGMSADTFYNKFKG